MTASEHASSTCLLGDAMCDASDPIHFRRERSNISSTLSPAGSCWSPTTQTDRADILCLHALVPLPRRGAEPVRRPALRGGRQCEFVARRRRHARRGILAEPAGAVAIGEGIGALDIRGIGAGGKTRPVSRPSGRPHGVGAADHPRGNTGNPNGFKAVVLYYAMPSINGVDAAHQIQRLNASLPIVIIIGYVDAEQLRNTWQGRVRC